MVHHSEYIYDQQLYRYHSHEPEVHDYHHQYQFVSFCEQIIQ